MASDLSKLALEQSGVSTGGWSGNTLNMGAPLGGQVYQNPTLEQKNTGVFQMTAQGPQWSAPSSTPAAPAASNPNWLSVAPGGSGNTAAENARLQTANAGSASNQFMAGANAPMKTGQVTSLTNNPANPQMQQYQAMIQQLLMAQSKSSGGISDQYKAMLERLIGKGGLTSQLSDATKNYGAGQQELMAENQKKQQGSLEQDLTSRGLGNSTIRNSLLGGMKRDQGIQQQNLASNIAQQKMSSIPVSSNIELGAFNANPAQAQQSQYLQLLQQLGSAG